MSFSIQPSSEYAHSQASSYAPGAGLGPPSPPNEEKEKDEEEDSEGGEENRDQAEPAILSVPSRTSGSSMIMSSTLTGMEDHY